MFPRVWLNTDWRVINVTVDKKTTRSRKWKTKSILSNGDWKSIYLQATGNCLHINNSYPTNLAVNMAERINQDKSHIYEVLACWFTIRNTRN